MNNLFASSKSQPGDLDPFFRCHGKQQEHLAALPMNKQCTVACKQQKQHCQHNYTNGLHHAVCKAITPNRVAFVTFELPRDHTFYRPSQALRSSQIDRVQKQFLSTNCPSQSRLSGPLLISPRICAWLLLFSHLATAANSTQMCSPWHHLQDTQVNSNHCSSSFVPTSTAYQEKFCFSLLEKLIDLRVTRYLYQSTTIHHQTDPNWSKLRPRVTRVNGNRFHLLKQNLCSIAGASSSFTLILFIWLNADFVSSLRKLLATNRAQILEMILSYRNKTLNSKTRMRSAWSTIVQCASLGRFVEDCAQRLGSSGVRPCLSAIFLEAPALQANTQQQHQNQSAWFA